MATFTKTYSGLGGPLSFDVLLDTVDKNGTLTTVTAEIGSSFVLTDIFNVTGTSFADSIKSGNGAGNTLTGGSGNDTLAGGTSTDTLYGGDDNDLISLGGNSSGSNDYAYGGNGDDTINAGAGWVIANGEAGNDYIDLTGVGANTGKYTTASGGGNNDIILGSAGIDNLFGDDGNDSLDGGGGSDALSAGNGQDTLLGGAGNDTLTSTDIVAADVIDGGSETDSLTLTRTGQLSANIVDFSNAAILQTLGDGTTVVNVEKINFTSGSGNDTVTATNDAGGTSTNVLHGGDGNDVLNAATSAASLWGDNGNDTLTGSGVADDLRGGNDNDVITLGGNSTGSNDYAYGDAGNDTIYGCTGWVVAYGDAGNDTIDLTGAGINTGKYTYAYGGANDDVTIGSAGIDNLFGDDGNDSLDGGGGSDALSAGNGQDTLLGGAGNDTLTSTDIVAADVIDGGSETDTLTLTRTGQLSANIVDFSNAALLQTLGDGTTVVNVEKINFTSGSGDDVITATNDAGGTSTNVLHGGDGNDVLNAATSAASLWGDNGNDTLVGSANADDLRGGGDDDLITLGGTTGGSSDYAYGDAGNDTVYGGVGYANVDGGSGSDLIDLSAAGVNTGKYTTAHGGADADTIIGSTGSDAIYGEGGADTLSDGGGGNDTMQGGSESDSITSLGGQDTIDGGTETDFLSLQRTAAVAALTFVVTSTSATTTLVGDGTTVVNVERFEIVGGAAGDTFTTVGADDILDGRGGADTLSGGGGNDTISDDNAANADADQLNGGSGDDTLTSLGGVDAIDGGAGTADLAVIDRSAASGSLSFVVTDTGGTTTLAGDGTTVINVERFSLTGGSAVDTFTTHDGADTLEGNGGNDLLDGGNGSDTAVFGGGRGTYLIERIDGSSTTWVVTDTDTVANGDDGSDTLANIESLSFLSGSPATLTVASLIGSLSDSDGAANTVSEAAAIGTAVGITALATDGNSEAVTYSLTDSAGGRFSVNASTGVVTVASGLDFDTTTSHGITVRATSADGSFTDKSFTIAVTNAAPASPVDSNAPTNGSVAENASGGTAVGITASAADPGGGTITYALTDDAGGRFEIDASSGIVTVKAGAVIDREATASHAIVVHAEDASGLFSSDTAFTIAVTDVDESDVTAPADTDGTANAVAENVATGTVVGITALAADVDATSNSITYSLTSNPGNLFAIDAMSGVVTTAAAIDRETAGASVNIVIQAQSSDGSTASDTFAIAISDANDAPAAITLSAAAIVENNAAGALVGTLGASDADSATGFAGPFAYALVAGTGDADNAAFSITGGNELHIAGSADFETKASYTIRVRVTDAGGASHEEVKTVYVANISPEVRTGTAAAEALTGGSDIDQLYGLAGNDTLTGGSGNDLLVGGAGKDSMTGGLGSSDVFDFNAASESGKTAALRDVITDFEHLVDRIDLSTIDASTKKAGNQAFKFIGAQTFHKVAGELHVRTEGGNRIIEGDTNGDGKADFQIQVNGNVTLTIGDFIL